MRKLLGFCIIVFVLGFSQWMFNNILSGRVNFEVVLFCSVAVFAFMAKVTRTEGYRAAGLAGWPGHIHPIVRFAADTLS